MIKNLIFDVGNVLVGYRWKDMLADHNYEEPLLTRIGESVFLDPVWKEFDSGRHSLEEMKAIYAEKYPDIAEHIAFFLDHSVEMRVPRPEVWDKIAQLKKNGYAIYILSNYSEAMFNIHTEGIPVLDILDGRVVSYENGLLKPNADIYQFLLGKYQLNAEECLFFDDLQENVEAAIAEGIQSIQVLSEEQFLIELEKL